MLRATECRGNRRPMLECSAAHGSIVRRTPRARASSRGPDAGPGASARLGPPRDGALVAAFLLGSSADVAGAAGAPRPARRGGALEPRRPAAAPRFPAREVGIVSTVARDGRGHRRRLRRGSTVDALPFYGLVILGAALRFGLGASIWSAIVMAGMYLAVVLARCGRRPRSPAPSGAGRLPHRLRRRGRPVQPHRHRSRDRECAAPARLDEEERERERARERELLSRLGRDFAASLEREPRRSDRFGSRPAAGRCHLVFTRRRRDAPARPRRAGRRRRPAGRALASPFASAGRRASARGSLGAVGGDRGDGRGHPGNRDRRPGRDAGLGLGWLLAVPIVAGGRLHGVLATAGCRCRPPSDRSRAWPRPSPIAPDRRSRTRSCGPTSRSGWPGSRRRSASRTTSSRSSATSCGRRSRASRATPSCSRARLRGEHDGESKEMAHLRVIRSQVGRMRRLVDDLLDVSRIDRRGASASSRSTSTWPRRFARRSPHPARAPRPGIALRAPESLAVHADRDRIDQVLSNLLENAVKYSPDGGPILVSPSGVAARSRSASPTPASASPRSTARTSSSASTRPMATPAGVASVASAWASTSAAPSSTRTAGGSGRREHRGRLGIGLRLPHPARGHAAGPVRDRADR